MLAALFGGLAVVSGCNNEEPVAAYSVPKEPAKPAQSASAGPRQGGVVPQWTVPAGWKVVPASGMRFAAFAITEDEPPVTLTVIPLPSSPLLANVNRWEGELGLPPSDEAGLDKVVQHIDSDGGAHVDLVDLTGPESPDKPRQRMLAALIENQGRTWFFKAVGPAEKMAAQRENFEKLLRSVKFADAPAVAKVPAPATSTAAAPPQNQQQQQQQSKPTAKTARPAYSKPESSKHDE